MAKKRQPLKIAKTLKAALKDAKTKRRRPNTNTAQQAAVPVTPELPDGLTHKQSRFVEEFLIDLNATQAAIRAGYSKKTAQAIGAENLTKPLIQKALADARAKLRAQLQVEREDLIRELLKMGMSNALDYMRILPDGEPCVDFSRLTRDQAAAISEVTVEDYTDGRGEDAREVKRVRYKTADKRAALMDAAKLLGWSKDRIEHSGGVTVSKEEYEAFADALEDDEMRSLHATLANVRARMLARKGS
jgi:phage terminase small subunit